MVRSLYSEAGLITGVTPVSKSTFEGPEYAELTIYEFLKNNTGAL